MRRVAGLEKLPRNAPWPVVTVGTFDGVHTGHQRVLSELVHWAHENSGTAVVVTFEQPPRAVLTAENPPLVTSLPHRLVLLERLGVDLCLVLDFTPELAATTAREFVRRVFVEGLHARGVVVGHGSAFGRHREGDEEFLKKCAVEFAFEVRSVPPVVVDAEVVSSSRIRGMVVQGDLDGAARLLGRPFSVFGTVVRGSGRGRALGFPTANMDLHQELRPPDGVYVARAVLDGESFRALASVGTRPTFARGSGAEAAEPVVEIHLLDFDRQIYGRDLEAQLLRRLRGQTEFADVKALIAQMKDDRRRADEYDSGCGEAV
jgi:riboflavin kinase/FMN adenylyltransferase